MATTLPSPHTAGGITSALACVSLQNTAAAEAPTASIALKIDKLKLFMKTSHKISLSKISLSEINLSLDGLALGTSPINSQSCNTFLTAFNFSGLPQIFQIK